MAQIMTAVVGVLNESLTESLKGFYKMRKAYATLDGIVRMEERYLQNHRLPKARTAPPNFTLEKTSSAKKPTSAHSSKSDQDLRRHLSELKLADHESQSVPASIPSSTPGTPVGETFVQDPDSDIFSNPIDAFIHSGTSLCLGMLLSMLSTLPPTFSRILAIVGFRGDKIRGLRMLWQASKFPGLIGAVAGLGVLGYYNGFIRVLDIIPDVVPGDDRGIEGYPLERLVGLLSNMRAQYPKSLLWLLEEARMKSASRNIETAIEMLKNSNKSPLKQVEALRTFEMSMNSMYLHRYEDCANNFIGVRSPYKISFLHFFFFSFLVIRSGSDINAVCGTQLLVTGAVLLHRRICLCRSIPSNCRYRLRCSSSLRRKGERLYPQGAHGGR